MEQNTQFPARGGGGVLHKANGSNCVLRKYTVTAVCRIVIAVCALIKTMICFSSERSRLANVGLMLGQCSRRQDNIKYTLWSAWRLITSLLNYCLLSIENNDKAS